MSGSPRDDLMAVELCPQAAADKDNRGYYGPVPLFMG
jgi:hypothetical protein